MPLLVDDRAGSSDLIPGLAKLGLPVESTRLDFGDLYFMGRGVKGAPVHIGVEHKKLPDLIQSLDSGRLQGHQLPGMLEHYDRCWLVVEGDWTHDPSGRAAVFKGRGIRRPLRGSPLAVELEKWLLGLEVRGGLHIVRCNARRDSLRFLCALYRWWTDKDLDRHKSHLAVHAPDADAATGAKQSQQFVALAAWPGIGYKTAAAVERECGGDLRRTMMWDEDRWASITTVDENGKTRRLGNPRAKTVMNFLAGKE